MDRNIYDNDFEEFLKLKSDQYKMYPSDRVWNNVYSSLHGRKKWWALGFTLFFIGAGLLAGREVLLSNYTRMATQLNKNTETPSPENLVKNNIPLTARQNISVAKIKNTTTAVTPITNSAVTIQRRDNNTGSNIIPAEQLTENNIDNKTAGSSAEAALTIENNLLPAVPAIHNHTGSGVSFSIPQKQFLLNKTIIQTDKISKQESAKPINQVENAAAVESLKFSRWAVQLYASPTISYRRLSTIDQNNNTIPVANGYAGDINRYVRHKPAPGFELGSNVQYKLSNSLTVFAGAQLNYSRYYIDAFKYHTEKASIAVNNPQVHDTLSGYTDIRNFSGYAPEQLQNKYLQLSIPVGIEIKLLGDKKLQFSVAGGIQPTFLLASTSYLISSDYKNYIQSPDLARGFNVHTNFEAFISYKTGGLKWQVGPQFRSQLLSSYSNQYRVREYLTEYGIKFGVTRSF
ncbi:MAG: hypothetical protein ABJC98_10910 [Bacteroidota bacterium]